MFIFAAIKTAFRALRANMGRSLLTILGIVIGIVAIVLVIALGQGAQSLILNEINSIGANTIILRPGRQPDNPTDFSDTLFADSITDRDIAALRKERNVPGVTTVAPAVVVPGNISYRDEIYRPTILGWTSDALVDMFQIYPEEGTYFTEDDTRQRAKVAVIGHKVKNELFGPEPAIGKFVTIQQQKLRVTGVLPKRGQVTFFNVDDIVLVPYSTAQRNILGINHFHEVFIKSDETADVDVVADDIRATLRETHGITDPDKDDFFVTTQEEAAEIISTVTQVLTVFLVAIASISLVVGGVGIMNIMLVSVTERTHEIGLRKAVGATRKDILLQFLLEAIILTLSGGVAGTTLAVGLSALVATIARQQYDLNWPFSLPVGAILLGVGVATAVGLVFGLYPARTAARKDPIEALRYE